MLQVQSGSGCQIDSRGCATTGPGNYGNGERCTIHVPSSGWLTATHFDTEPRHDYVSIGGTRYQGRTGPDGVAVVAGSTFWWHSDRSVTNAGWTICLSTGPAPIELTGGNDGSARNLQACTGECDADRQCAGGLKCFQRVNGGAIPGCRGAGGGAEWDYCYNDSPTAGSSNCFRRLCSISYDPTHSTRATWPCGSSRFGTHFFNRAGMPGVSLTAAGQNFCQRIKSCRGLYPPGPSSSPSFCHSWDHVASAHTRCCCTST